MYTHTHTHTHMRAQALKHTSMHARQPTLTHTAPPTPKKNLLFDASLGNDRRLGRLEHCQVQRLLVHVQFLSHMTNVKKQSIMA